MKLHSCTVAAVTLLVLVTLGGGVAYGISWEVGLKAGMTSAKLLGDPVTMWLGEGEDQLAGAISDSKLGFIGGGYVKATFSPLFGIQTEILYKQKGGKGPAEGIAVVTPPNSLPMESTFEGTLSLYLDYIEVPVLAMFSFQTSEGGRLTLHGYFGPTFSYNTAAEVRLEGEAFVPTLPVNEQWITVDEKKDAAAQVENFELGGLIGVSLSYAFEGMDVILDARWGRGFTTIDNTVNERSSYNSGFDFMAGFAIPLGGE